MSHTSPDLITQAELARRKGCNKSTVSRLVRSRLADAVAGDRVDASHPAVVAWLGGDSSAEGEPQSGKPQLTKEEFSRLTYRKRKAEAEKLELQNAQARGELIDREMVRVHVFGPLEELSQRLLRDHPKTMATQAHELCSAGARPEELETLIRESVSSALVATRAKIVRALKTAAKKAAAAEELNS